MFGSKKNPGLGRTVATGLVVDPELRRAAARAAPPVARFGYTLGKRMASQQVRLREPEPPPRRRLLPVAAGIAVVAVTVVMATDPARRRRLQRLFIH